MIKSEELRNPDSCLNRAEPGENLFVLLGRDKATPATIRFWVRERIALGKNVLGDPQISEALRAADRIEAQQKP